MLDGARAELKKFWASRSGGDKFWIYTSAFMATASLILYSIPKPEKAKKRDRKKAIRQQDKNLLEFKQVGLDTVTGDEKKVHGSKWS
eukprot:Clim_evm96s149 gene=Clim_evmTU96s149